MVRLLADENFPLPVVGALRRLGFEVVTLQEVGYGDQGLSDSEVLSLAEMNDRAVVTLNRRHFVRLHAESGGHRGIIVCTFDGDFIGQANRIAVALEGMGSLAGQLVRINRPAV